MTVNRLKMAREPIAIIGMGCRFPGARNPTQFWQLLREGIDAIAEAPADRPTGQKEPGGYLEGVDRFDARFFKISPGEAVTIDPQYRFLLEVTWEALEDAGQIPEKLRGTETSVFTGFSHSDYYGLMSLEKKEFKFDSIAGNHPCMAANLICYHYDFRGACLTINSACSSSLAAVELACQSLWNGDASLALASGVNMNFSTLVSEAFTDAGLIAEDGRCRSFDAGADGYVRSEGVAVVVLKLLSRARADNDRIYAVIRGAKINHNGRGNGLTVPNKRAQETLFRKVYLEAGIPTDSVHYIEAHGTATPIGDILEMKALGEVIGRGRTAENPCRVGCVKTNIGHTEAAAGIAGLIKVALSLHNRQIPPNLHYDRHHPEIPLPELGLKVQQELESLPEEIGSLRAGISAFGFGGTNGHVILESAPPQPDTKSKISSIPLQILTLTAKTEGALQKLAAHYRAFLESEPEISLEEICFTANIKRSRFNHRLAIVTGSKEQLKERLDAYLQDKASPHIIIGEVSRKKTVPIGFILSGKAHKFKEVIRTYYNECLDFRSYLEEGDSIFNFHAEKLFGEIIDGGSSDVSLHPEAVNFLLESALVQLWEFWGIEPEIVAGYGVGQYTAATSAGIMTTGEAIEAIKNCQDAPDLSRLLETLSDRPYIFLDVDDGSLKNPAVQEQDGGNIKIDGLDIIFYTLMKLWSGGAKVAWDKVGNYRGYYPISLPGYPFEGESYWMNSSTSNTLISVSDGRVESEDDPVTVTSPPIQKHSPQTLITPIDELESSLANIWSQVLNIEKVDVNDNFFELGGDSKLALVLVAEIEKIFQCRLPVATFFQTGTIAEIAKIMNEQDRQKICQSLLVIKPGNLQPPLFFIHVLGRGLKFCLPLAGHLNLERPIYGLNTQIMDKKLAPSNDVGELADYYIREMRTIQPEGPYFLAGISFGGLVAYEMARKLGGEDGRVAFLGLIDAVTAQAVQKLPASEKMRAHWQNLSGSGFTYILEKLQAKVKGKISRIKSKYNFSLIKSSYHFGSKLGIPIPTDVEDLIFADENYRALLKYIPRAYPGKVILFSATDKDLGVSYQIDPTLGWGNIGLDGLEIKEIPGTHLGILEEPNVRFLARQMKAEIDKVTENNQHR